MGRSIGVLFAIVGTLQLAWCLVDSSSAIMAGGWPTTSGIVQTSKVEVVGSGRYTGYQPSVTYTYTVGGASFLGQRIWFRDFTDLPDRARRTVDAFPVGATVQVHYNAAHPELSLLRPGLSWYSFAWLGLSVLAIVVGGGAIVWNATRQIPAA